VTLSIDDAKALGIERKGITLKSYVLSFVLAACVTATAQATTKSEICGWPADIYRATQEKCACNAGNGRCEVLAAAEKPEMSE